MIAHLPADQRELAHGSLFAALLGTIQPVVAKSGARSFEITAGLRVRRMAPRTRDNVAGRT